MIESAGLKVFSLASSHTLGEEIAANLRLDPGRHEERAFEDGEHKARPLESVRDADVYVVDSLFADATESVNDKLCRLLFFLGALRDASAARLTAVVPYLCYTRKDRKTKSRDPVTTRYVARLFEAVGIDRLVTVDVHNLAAFQNAFRCGTEHLEARPLLASHLAPRLHDVDVVVVSPDAGGMKRAEAFRETLTRQLGRPVTTAFMEKQRSAGSVSGDRLFGNVSGRAAVILDDMISTGTTICRAAATCRSAGAVRVMAAATHGLFLGDAPERLSEADLDALIVTSTVPPFRLVHAPIHTRLTLLDVAPMLAEGIRRMHGGGSIVELNEA